MILSSEYLLLVFATLAMAAIESFRLWRHRQNLQKIPVRIHVNGTRGKSSVTRLITAGLSAGGLKVFAKTTGTLPRLILPHGREYPVFRPGGANVIEQKRIVSIAADNGADCLVVECMALNPLLQWLSEEKLIRATHGVITNARPDHLDVMGPAEEDVAKALASTVPLNGKAFIGIGAHQEIFQAAAQDRRSEYFHIGEEEVAAVEPKDLAKFSYMEHAENVALALKVCADLGVDRKKALAGMQKAKPDPGAMVDFEIHFFGGRRFHFINGFAANDPSSTEKVWRLAIDQFKDVKNRIAIFNCRADRPERSFQLGKAFVGWPPPDQVVLMGTGTFIFARAAEQAGFDLGKVSFADEGNVESIFERIVDIAGPSALIVGMGNIGGAGLELVRFFKNRAVIKEKEREA
ncbi:MAG: poly-gamma-glutamate synthase PgsB, partial [Deltaproteobacteria bacterium]|nr:poly-gamma-glutamate synthase PgsB [Deltaproteobacteria bacterium]